MKPNPLSSLNHLTSPIILDGIITPLECFQNSKLMIRNV
jgi:hypothetical protein